MADDAHQRALEGQLEETRKMMLAMSQQLAFLSSQVGEINSLKQQVAELEAVGSSLTPDHVCPDSADRAPKRARPGGGSPENDSGRTSRNRVSAAPTPTQGQHSSVQRGGGGDASWLQSIQDAELLFAQPDAREQEQQQQDGNEGPSSTPGTKRRRARRQEGCECGNAKRYPSFGYLEDGRYRARWCKLCPTRPPEAVDFSTLRRRCECGKKSKTFGMPGDGRSGARWCVECKPPEAVDVLSRRCPCGAATPTFSLPGTKGGTWCAKCPDKPPEAVDVLSKKCECGKGRPSQGLPGWKAKNARWCGSCPMKPPGAVDVRHPRCPCPKHVRPTIGLPGTRTPQWCPSCPDVPVDAVLISNKRTACECGLGSPTFALPGETRRRWCSGSARAVQKAPWTPRPESRQRGSRHSNPGRSDTSSPCEWMKDGTAAGL